VKGLSPGDRVITMGHHQQFVLATGLLTGRKPAIPLPDDVGWDDAPFGCWGRSCINWMRRAGIRHYESVTVVGCGLVGLLMVMWSRLSSPRQVIAIDLSEKRLELAKKAGADTVLNPRAGDVVEGVRALTGEGSDITLHCVGGVAVKSFETSQLVTRNGGRVVLVGHHWADLSILPHQFTGKDLLGAGVGSDSDPRLFVDGLQLLQAGRLPVAEIVTHKEPYTSAPTIYDMLIEDPEDAGAILLEWDGFGSRR
jgi:L-iditol 2-dehydrogenase